MKAITLDSLKNEYIGQPGTPEREQYEYQLNMEVLGRMIKQVRKERQLTQEELGEMVGVQKARISKIESSANSATIDTILRIFSAMNAEVFFNVKLKA